MNLRRPPPSWARRGGPWLVLGAMAACAAQTPPASAPPAAAATPRGLLALPALPPGPRLVLLLDRDVPDVTALAVRLSKLAQLPLRELRPLGGRRWGVLLACEGPAACAPTVQRLAAAGELVLAVEPDPEVHVPPRPSGPQAR